MDASAGGADLSILLHAVDEQVDRFGLEVNVTVQGQQVAVLGLCGVSTSCTEYMYIKSLYHHVLLLVMVKVPRNYEYDLC